MVFAAKPARDSRTVRPADRNRDPKLYLPPGRIPRKVTSGNVGKYPVGRSKQKYRKPKHGLDLTKVIQAELPSALWQM